MPFLMILKAFIAKYWKPLLMVVLPVAGFLLGRFMAPAPADRIVEKLHIEYVEKQVVVEHETVRVEVVRVKDTQVVERWHREKTETKTPDGAVVTREVEDRNIDSVVHDRENTVEVKVVTVETQVVVEKLVDREVVVDNRRNWRVAPMVGINIPKAIETQGLGIQSWVFGASAERRILGNVWGGVWANTTGTAGLQVGIEF